ncbi:MAG: DUF3445 domain-containing protein [Pseudomonadota bacterium]
MSQNKAMELESFPPFPIEAGDFRLAMGLRPIQPDAWLFKGPDHAQQMAARHRLLDQQPQDVAACEPSAEAAARAVHHLATGAPASTTGLAALEAVGRTVQEDMCILQSEGEDQPYRLMGGILCFPNRWCLADKLGKPLMAIHDPVPDYGRKLGPAVDRFFARLKPDHITMRMNWSLHPDAVLFHPSAPKDQPVVEAKSVPTQVFLRVERQTIRRIEKVGSATVLFTIRTMIATLGDALTDPDRMARLDHALATMPAAMLAYKSMDRLVAPVRAWLAEQRP